MLELLAEVDGAPGRSRSWDSPLRGARWLRSLGCDQAGPVLGEEGDGGEVKSLWGPRGEQREGLGILGQKDGVEAASTPPELEASPLLSVLLAM